MVAHTQCLLCIASSSSIFLISLFTECLNNNSILVGLFIFVWLVVTVAVYGAVAIAVAIAVADTDVVVAVAVLRFSSRFISI